jgi:hypothetical protein
LFGSYAHAAGDSETHIRAALTSGGDAVRVIVANGGKKPGVKLEVKGKTKDVYAGEAVATIEAGHGRVLVAVSIESAKTPFQIIVIDGDTVSKPTGIARPNKRDDYPFAIAATPTPDGFTVFFQEVQTDNPNEAHTYLVKLDKTGAVEGEAKEIQVPWWLAAAAWNGNGYHLGLFYAGQGNGTILSMVSLTKDGAPEQHPDWASQAGTIKDVHLVATGNSIRVYYRGTGDRMIESDVTKIGQWGQVSTKAKDLGALSAKQSIAITAKGAAIKVGATSSPGSAK